MLPVQPGVENHLHGRWVALLGPQAQKRIPKRKVSLEKRPKPWQEAVERSPAKKEKSKRACLGGVVYCYCRLRLGAMHVLFLCSRLKLTKGCSYPSGKSLQKGKALQKG